MAKKKYSEFYGVLPPKDPFEDKPGMRERIEAAKERYMAVCAACSLMHADTATKYDHDFLGLSIAAFGRFIRTEKDVKEKLEAEVSEHEVEIAALSELIFPDMIAQRVENIRVEGAGTLYPRFDPMVTVRDKEVFRKWCIENGFEEQLALPWSTANAVAKERLEAGKEEMPGTELYLKTSAVLLRK